MRAEEFCNRYPVVFHLANEANWPSIQKHGLLSTQTCCKEVLRLDHDQMKAIVFSHRPRAQVFDGITIRDQKPLNESKLISCLTDSGLTPQDWYAILNERVFFWTTRKGLERFMAVYAKEPSRILEVDSEKLLARHERSIELCPINSGATRMPHHYRCRASFQPIADFAFSSKHKPVELTLIGGVKDILGLLVSHH